MYEDIERLVADVARDVAEGEDSGRPFQRLRAACALRAQAADVWAALTDAARISQWLSPITGDLRPGGAYRIAGVADGTIEACEPQRRIDAIWNAATGPGRVGVQLAPAEGGVCLSIEHVTQADPVRWAKFGPAMIGVGWDLALLGLARHLAAPAAPAPQEWIFSDDGRIYVRQAASAWGKAAAAAGHDKLLALEAAARAAQAYAGEGSDAG